MSERARWRDEVMRRGAWVLGAALMMVLWMVPLSVWAQDAQAAQQAQVSAMIPGAGGNPLGMIVLLGGLSLLPFLLVMVTSFVKVAVVLSLLRTAIGAQQVPPNQVITGLAVILSLYIMAPVGMQMMEEVKPVMTQVEAKTFKPKVKDISEIATRVTKPLSTFLIKHADETERLLLYELALELRTEEQREGVTPEDFLIAAPAFVMTELKEAFTIGFLLFIPFLIIDLVVANILLSLGMHMLSPTTVSLPFKLLLFVVVDGWYLVIKGLILGYV